MVVHDPTHYLLAKTYLEYTDSVLLTVTF